MHEPGDNSQPGCYEAVDRIKMSFVRILSWKNDRFLIRMYVMHEQSRIRFSFFENLSSILAKNVLIEKYCYMKSRINRQVFMILSHERFA